MVSTPAASQQAVLTSFMILSRLNGTRIWAQNNVVNQGEKIQVNLVNVSKNATLTVMSTKSGTLGTIKTDQYGNGNTQVVLNVPGIQTINVADPARSTSYNESVFVAAKPGSTPPAPPSPTTTTAPAPASTPKLTISPSSGKAGDKVTLTSSGWAPFASLTYQWPPPIGTLATDLKADALGNFNSNISIDPLLQPGSYTITMYETNNPSKRAQATFTSTNPATTTKPPAPPSTNQPPSPNPSTQQPTTSNTQQAGMTIEQFVIGNLPWIGVGVAVLIIILVLVYYPKHAGKLAARLTRGTKDAIATARAELKK